ncbi:hypothetical protein [Flavobacterium sp.]|uniref:hypothetical protein n=1 Tax=Flavobacterium sp. TaxID=239 RepID=UPI0035AEC2BC
MKKNIFLVLVLCFSFYGFSFFVRQKTNEKIKLTYLGYEINRNRFNYQNLNFEIINNTEDTIYLSEKNVFIVVIKEGRKLKEDKFQSIGTPYVRPVISKGFVYKEEKEYEEKVNSLKVKFANKLYEKNFGSNAVYKKDKEFIIESIVNNCIILMPYEILDYTSGFYSKKFDKTCKVSAKYIDSKRFTYFIDDNGKKIDINN